MDAMTEELAKKSQKIERLESELAECRAELERVKHDKTTGFRIETEAYQRQAAKWKKLYVGIYDRLTALAEAAELMRKLIDGIAIGRVELCADCSNDGCIPCCDNDGNMYPEQCDFCYTQENSLFNKAQEALTAYDQARKEG